jgi:mono/diheme cytochrome c family protein
MLVVKVFVVVLFAVTGALVGFGSQAQTEGKARVIAPKGYVARQPSTDSQEGRKLYDKMNCGACHSIAGNGGVNGPPLDGVGGRRSEKYLISQLTNPAEFARRNPQAHGWEPSWMPHPHATREQVRQLVAFLLTLPEPPGGFLVGPHGAPTIDANPPDQAMSWVPALASENSRRGRKLYFDAGCAACHSIGQFGGEFGPRLDGIGARHSRAYIVSYISSPGLKALTDPSASQTPPIMPHVDLTGAQVDAIADFLLTLPVAADEVP